MGRFSERHCGAGQTDVHDHDGDDGLHSVPSHFHPIHLPKKCAVFWPCVNQGFLCRGRGPLKGSMDVINAAKKISEAGSKLDKLCRQIADQVSNCSLPVGQIYKVSFVWKITMNFVSSVP